MANVVAVMLLCQFLSTLYVGYELLLGRD
jgi:hypothetical protein